MTYLQSRTQPKSSVSFAVGMLLGAIGVYFLSPRSGEENRKRFKDSMDKLKTNYDEQVRERVENIFGEVSNQGIQLYNHARKAIDVSLRNMNQTMQGIDFGKYQILVDEAISELKDDHNYLKDRMGAMRDELLEEWNQVHKEGNGNGITSVKKRLSKKSNGNNGDK